MLHYLLELARIAGDLARSHFAQVKADDFQTKGRSDFVSYVDRRIEDELRVRIRSHHPDHQVLGEEGFDGRPPAAGPCWIIDPIDGTTNFLRGIPHFAVSIAFCDDGQRPKYGAIIDPIRGETFLAERGGGLWINERRVTTSGQRTLEGALVSCALPFRNMAALDDISAVMLDLQSRVGDMRRIGSAALDLAYVAVGRVDAYWELGIWPWDTAAGELMVRCGGGACCDFQGRTEALLTRRSIIAAASPALLEALLGLIGPRLGPWLEREAYALTTAG